MQGLLVFYFFLLLSTTSGTRILYSDDASNLDTPDALSLMQSDYLFAFIDIIPGPNIYRSRDSPRTGLRHRRFAASRCLLTLSLSFFLRLSL